MLFVVFIIITFKQAILFNCCFILTRPAWNLQVLLGIYKSSLNFTGPPSILPVLLKLYSFCLHFFVLLEIFFEICLLFYRSCLIRYEAGNVVKDNKSLLGLIVACIGKQSRKTFAVDKSNLWTYYQWIPKVEPVLIKKGQTIETRRPKKPSSLQWSFSCFLCCFCSTGLYPDYTSSLHIRHNYS